MTKIAIIIGSTRPGRNGEAVAKWVYESRKSAATPSSNLWTSKISTCRFWTSRRHQ
jgi:NAD(P)H-dependent FMN reductase